LTNKRKVAALQDGSNPEEEETRQEFQAHLAAHLQALIPKDRPQGLTAGVSRQVRHTGVPLGDSSKVSLDARARTKETMRAVAGGVRSPVSICIMLANNVLW
jgi:hypothetical protein